MAQVDLLRLTKENQRFFLNSQEISGLQSINGQYEVSHFPFKFLGMTGCSIVQQGNQIGNFNLNYLLITQDLFKNYTGISGFNGYILQETGFSNNFSFTSGYLTNYSLRCSVGQIPEISIAISVFGNVGKINSGESTGVLNDFRFIETGAQTSLPLTITAPGSIDLTLNEFNTNRVTSFELNIDCPRLPIYALGVTTPIEVKLNNPIEVNCVFQFETYQYTPSSLRNFKCSPRVENCAISLKTYDTNQEVLNFNFNNMTLVSENYSTTVSDNVIVVAKYKTYLMI